MDRGRRSGRFGEHDPHVPGGGRLTTQGPAWVFEGSRPRGDGGDRRGVPRGSPCRRPSEESGPPCFRLDECDGVTRPRRAHGRETPRGGRRRDYGRKPKCEQDKRGVLAGGCRPPPRASPPLSRPRRGRRGGKTRGGPPPSPPPGRPGSSLMYRTISSPPAPRRSCFFTP